MVFDPNSPEERRKRNRRFAAVLLFGIAALILGFVQLSNSIRGPLRPVGNQNTSLTYEEIQSLGSLREKDTDADAISDYEELYTYKTSPYLKDSDSDGIDDRTEIQSGADPNCPKGQACGTVAGTPSANANTNVTGSAGNTNQLTLGSTNVSPAHLRETLKNAGVPQSQLDSLDDATLLRIYGDVLAETPAPSTNATTNAVLANVSLTNLPANASVSTETLQNLSAADIRQLLIAAGVDANLINTIDDVTLRAIFLQAIEGGTPQP